MAHVRTLSRSFAGGEVTPEFFGRVDDVKYQTGLALCENFIVLPHGPVANRAGTAFVRAVKFSSERTRVISFSFSTTQTMVLEFGPNYIRFHTNGATVLSAGVPYEVATPYLVGDLFDIHFVQSADVLTLVHPNYAPRELRRLGPTNWTLTTISFAPVFLPPTNVRATAKLASSPTSLRTYSYKLTSVGDENQNESLVSLASVSTDVAITGVTNANPGVVTLAGEPTFSVGQEVTLASVGGMPALAGVFMIETFTSALKSFGIIVVPAKITLRNGGGVVDTSGMPAYTGGGTVTPSAVTNNLLQTGATNTITWSAVSGAARYKVYKEDNGLFGYIGETTALVFADDNITADLSIAPPQVSDPFTGTGNYPGAVSYHQQRRVFAGTTNKPQNLWLTRSGTESNLTYSLPSRDDDAIAVRVAAREANTIRHIVPLNELLLLTSSAEWRVQSANSDVLTPSSISVRPQSYIGASNVQPAVVNNTVIYNAARGGHVREMAYNWQAGGYLTGDLSLRAPHLFDNFTLVDMAFAKSPHPIVWAVSSNGKLLGLTYVPEQQVGAWHQHTTDGFFESVCVVTEENEDVLYAVVRRVVNNATVRYVERMRPRQFAILADAFFVDAGATYAGVPITTVSGLTWLEGKTVSILADGAVHPQRLVIGGTVTLDNPASVITVGLPIEANLQTLPLTFETQAFGQGRAKNVNKVWLRVFRSSGIFVGPDQNSLVEAKQRTTEAYGNPPALKTEEIEVTLKPAWVDNGQIYVRQADPLPLTIVAMTLETAIGA